MKQMESEKEQNKKLFSTILVTGCGGDIGLSIAKVIRDSGISENVYGCDIHDNHPGKFVYDDFSIVNRADNKNYLQDIKKIIDKFKIDLIIPTSENEISFFVENGFESQLNEIPVLLANKKAIFCGLDKLNKNKFNNVIEKMSELKEILKTDFDHDLMINSTFGPLKFNKPKTVVFHLMIYDVEGHITHCIKSPFTCLEWERSKHFIKKSLGEIYPVNILQPNFFFNARRGVNDYIKDLVGGVISFREYSFKNGIKEIKKHKNMTNKDRFEFSYHIMKFVMLNFIKLYDNKNLFYTTNKIADRFFSIFSKNKSVYSKFLIKILQYKSRNVFPNWTSNDKKNLLSFLKDFELQFNNYFESNSSKLYFLRHQKTDGNKKGLFLGQRLDPGILNVDAQIKNKLIDFLKDKAILRAYSSPMKRCIDTVNILRSSVYGSQVIIDYNLLELDVGEMDGKSYDYLKVKYPHLIKEWGEGKDPKFPGGESSRDVEKRVEEFLKSISENSKNSLICTHNVVLRVLTGIINNIPMKYWYKIEVSHIDPIEVIVTKDKKLYINLTETQRIKMFENFR